MENEQLFKEIGKKTTYKVPTGFFDQISERTLAKAKQEEIKHREIHFKWIVLVAAASLISFVILGQYLFKSENPASTSGSQIVNSQIVNNELKAVPETIKWKGNAIKGDDQVENSAEGLNSILNEISDEELSQLSAEIKTDVFMADLFQ